MNKFILTFLYVCIFCSLAVGENLSKESSQIWNHPLDVDYHNLDYSYETSIRVIECLKQDKKIYTNSLSNELLDCIKQKLDRSSLAGKEDSDSQAYSRHLIEGPPKEGPYTRIRLLPVGKTKSLIQIESYGWSILWGNQDLPYLAKIRFEEIQMILKSENLK